MRSQLHILTGLLVLLVGISSPAFGAVELKNLYKAERILPVNAVNNQEAKAKREAMAEVLIRVSGYRTVLADEGIQGALLSVDKYLSRFFYEQSSQTQLSALGEVVRTKRLVLEFDEQQINQLLSENALTVWGKRRPQVLVWLAYNAGGRRELADLDTDQEVALAMIMEASQRGVPVQLPNMDFEDELNISPLDVWGMFSDSIENASLRYQPEAVLAGRAEKVGSGWRADWILLFSGEKRRFQAIGNTEQELMNRTVNMVAERLADQYAIVLDDYFTSDVQLTVSGIETIQQYQQLNQYVAGLTGVNAATVSHVNGNEVTLGLELSGDVQQLKDIIALDDRLTPQDLVTSDSSDLLDHVFFVWQP